MDITLKAIEEIKLSNTEEYIIEFLEKQVSNKTTLRIIGDSIDVLYPTLCKELKKLSSKSIVIINENEISLSEFGLRLCNFNNFKFKILQDFCKKNNIDESTYEMFINSKNYSNMKLLLGIKNLLIKEEFRK